MAHIHPLYSDRQLLAGNSPRKILATQNILAQGIDAYFVDNFAKP